MKIAIITAPRKIPTLHSCIKSVRKAGYTDTIEIFAEPGAVADFPNVHRNEVCLGALGNFNRALSYMVERSDYMVILNDDLFLYHKAFKYIDLTKNFGYLCMCTIEQDINEEDRNKKGWIKIDKGFHTWGAGFIMHKKVAIELLNHPFYQERLKVSPEKGIDAAVSESMLQMGYSMYAHNPSLTEHIGEFSSIEGRGVWSNHGRCTFNFKKWRSF